MCDGHCSLESCFGKCGNFFIENGVPGCSRTGSRGTFKASRAQSTVMDTITPQIQEVLRLMKTYLGLCQRSKQAHKEYLQSELNMLKTRVARLARLIELKRAYQARRQKLLLEHPYGYVEDLGYNLSDASLEAMHRATKDPEEFRDPDSFISSVNNQESLLSNPKKLAALRLTEYLSET